MTEYAVHTSPAHTAASKADLRDVEQYWNDRIVAMEDDFRRHREATQTRIHKLEAQLAAMQKRWPGGWGTA